MEDLLSCVWVAPASVSGEELRRKGERKEGEGIVTDVGRSSVLEEEKDMLMSGESAVNSAEVQKLFVSRAWALSAAPAKNLGPSLFMIYMMGGGVFGLMFLGFSMLNAVKALLAVNKQFDELERAAKVRQNTVLQRIASILICLAFIAFFSYRAVNSGLLPIGHSASLHLQPRNREEAIQIRLVK